MAFPAIQMAEYQQDEKQKGAILQRLILIF